MNINELKQDLLKNIQAIKDLMDADVTVEDIEARRTKLLKLTQISSLAAYCKSQAKRIQRMKELEVLMELEEKKYSPSFLSKMLDARCADEEALFIYADRLNAFLSHAIDGLRSEISLYKSELENQLIRT